MAKKTKQERIREKVSAGMSERQALMEVKNEDHQAEMSKLRAQEKAEVLKVRSTITDLLEKEQPDEFAKLEKRARRKIAEDAAKRRDRAKSSKTTTQQVPVEPEAPVAPVQHGEARQYQPQ